MHIVKYHYQVWMNQVKYCRCDSLVWSQGSIVWLPGRRLHFWEDFFWKLTENFIKSSLNLKPWSNGLLPVQADHLGNTSPHENTTDQTHAKMKQGGQTEPYHDSSPMSVDVSFSKIVFASLTILCNASFVPYSWWQGSGKNETNHNQHNHFTAYCYTIERTMSSHEILR